MEQMISQVLKIVPLLSSTDITAGVDSDSVSMKGVKSATFQLVFGPSYTEAGGTGGAVVKLYEGASHGAKTTALTFNYRYGSAAIKSATADVLSAVATSAALTAAAATYTSAMLLIELNADQMTDGMTHLTLEIGSQAGAGELCIIALLDPMYQSPGGDTVIA